MSLSDRQRLRLLVFAPVCSAFLFVMVHLIVSQGDITRVRFAFSIGFLLGMVVVPEIDKALFMRPLILQIPAGCLAGTLFVAYLTSEPILWLIGGLIGAVIGWQARRWSKFVFQ